MKDELTVFFPDEIVTAVPTVFSEFGSRIFYENELEKVIVARKLNISVRKMLETMYATGHKSQLFYL